MMRDMIGTLTRAALTVRRRFLPILAVALLCPASIFAEEPVCRSKAGEVKVVYPELARRMKISGTVRLQLQLTPTGNVRETRILGGNPILVSAAQEAVKQAKFDGTDSCVIIFQFKE